MSVNYFDPNQFSKETDSLNIQAAVDEAARSGCNHVVIPAFNQRTGKYLWEIDQTILLPSHMYVEIDNAHLRMAEGVMCQMFRNSNCVTSQTALAQEMQEDIIIQGRGRAMLDGGVHNGLREDTAGKNGMPGIYNNLTIWLQRVRNFKIDGLTFRDQRFWGICLVCASEGIVSNIRFEIVDKCYRPGHPLNPTHPWKNQDGIDLRVGCHDIQIFNITGETTDDVIALTALADCGTTPGELDIYNVSISNINAFDNHCAIIRLLCHYGHKIYNISIDNIIDSTPVNNPIAVPDGQRTACCVKVGENGYHRNDPALGCKHGDLSHVRISNVFSNALTAVTMNCSAKDVEIRNIHVGEKGFNAVTVSRVTGGKHTDLENPENITTVENVLVDGVYFDSKQEDGVPFLTNNMQAKNVKVCNVHYSGDNLLKTYQPREDSESIVFADVK